MRHQKAFDLSFGTAHLATSVTLSNGVPIETVSTMLGHTTTRTTQIYAKVVEQKVSQDMASLRNRLEENEQNDLKVLKG